MRYDLPQTLVPRWDPVSTGQMRGSSFDNRWSGAPPGGLLAGTGVVDARWSSPSPWAVSALAATLWLLAFTTAAGSLERSKWQIGNAYLLAVLLNLGGISLIRTVWLAHRSAAVMFNAYTRCVFWTLVAWCGVTLFRMDWSDWSTTVKLAWGGQYLAWAWIIPVSMILGADLGLWRRALGVISRLSALGCAILICGWPLLSLRYDFGFTRACPVALLFHQYMPRWAKRVVLFGSFIALFLAGLNANRSDVFGIGLLILSASFIQFNRGHVHRVRIQIAVLLMFALAVGLIWYVASIDHVPVVGSYVNAGIASFKEKLLINTRAGEEGVFFPSFFAGMRGKDYVWGRGCMGTYEIEAGSPDLGFWIAGRRYIECGYLQVVLNGGLVMLILILSLAVPAIYLGLFHSRNWFTRGCAFVVLSRLLEMVPFGLPCADVRYVLFWTAVGACLTWRLRAMSEADIARAFTVK